MINKEQICAELYFILKQTPYSFIKLLPNDFMEKLKNKMSVEWYNNFDPDIVYTKQKFNNLTLKMLYEIRIKYWYEYK